MNEGRGRHLKEAAAVKYKISFWEFEWIFLNSGDDYIMQKEIYWHLTSLFS
jgi:hypothetical protein